MAQRLYLPRDQVFTDLGVVGAGWKLYSYTTLTTTPLATYSDTALSSANANPIIADSAGRLGDIFVDDLKDYKLVLKDADDNTIWTADPVDPKTFSVADFDPRPASFWGTTAGTSTVYTLDADPDVSTYASTQIFSFSCHLDCGASPTMAVDGLTALNLKKYDGAGSKSALEAGDMEAGQRYNATNDGTDIVIWNPEKPFFGNFDATETYKGIAEIATQAEVDAASDSTRIVTTDKLAGRAVQVVNTQTGAAATGSTPMPVDDTIPQNTEGDQYMSLAITPKNASNKLKIEVVIAYAASTANSALAAALFQDSTVNALAASATSIVSTTRSYPIVFTHYMTAGTTSATTFKVRMGTSSAGTTTFNGHGGARIFGGVAASSITITEIQV